MRQILALPSSLTPYSLLLTFHYLLFTSYISHPTPALDPLESPDLPFHPWPEWLFAFVHIPE